MTPTTKAAKHLLAQLDARPGPVSAHDLVAIEAEARGPLYEALYREHISSTRSHGILRYVASCPTCQLLKATERQTSV